MAQVNAGEVSFVPQLGLTDLDPIQLRFSPTDPRLLLVVNEGGRIDLFDLDDLDAPVKTAEIRAGATDAAFFPDGERIATAGLDGTVRVWDLEGDPLGRPLVGHTRQVRVVVVSPDGERIVSGSADGTLRVWGADGQLIAAHSDVHGYRIGCLVFTPDGSRFASAGQDGTIALWSRDGDPIQPAFRAHSEPINGLEITPDGKQLVSAGRDRVARAWNLDGDNVSTERVLQEHAESISALTRSPSGAHFASGSTDGELRVWTRGGVALTEPLNAHSDRIRAARWAGDGTFFATAAEDGLVRLWTLRGRELDTPFEGHRQGVTDLDVSPIGDHVVSGDITGWLLLWSLDGELAADAIYAGSWVKDVEFAPDGRSIAAAAGTVVRRWRLDGTELSTLGVGSRRGYSRALDYAPDGRALAVGTSSGSVVVWSLDGTHGTPDLVGAEGSIETVAFAPDGESIAAAGADGVVRRWSLDGELAAPPMRGHTGQVESLTFSPDGSRLASASQDGTIRLWGLDGAPIGAPIAAHDGPVYDVAFTPDGGHLLSVGDRSIRRWTLQGLESSRPIEQGWSHHLALSPDGARILTNDGDSIGTWGLEITPAARPLRGRHIDLESIAASSDARLLASGHEDGSLQLWTLDREHALFPPDVIEAHEAAVKRVALAPTTGRIATGGAHGDLAIWSLDGELIAQASTSDRSIRDLKFSPAGDYLAVGYFDFFDSPIRLWTSDLESVPAEPFASHRGWKSIAAFAPKRPLLLTGGFDGIVQARTLDGELLYTTPERTLRAGGLAVAPDGHLFAAGYSDGSIMLRTVEDGEQHSPPIQAHANSITGVAWTADSRRLVSRSRNGTVRLWDRDGRPAAAPFQSSSSYAPLEDQPWGNWFLIRDDDRVHVLSPELEPRGQIFLTPDGWLAITADGVLAPTDDQHAQVRAFAGDGGALVSRGSVPTINVARMRELLFDESTLWSRTQRRLLAAVQWTRARYEQLGWFKLAFWPALLWVLITLGVLATWLVRPQTVARWSMPEVVGPRLPPWQWLAHVVTLVRLFGGTRRALAAWVRVRHDRLAEQNFAARRPVRERERFSALGHETLFDAAVPALARGGPLYLWIDGPGGTGKSALAYALVRRATLDDSRARSQRPVPVLVDEDWGAELVGHVARLLHLDDESRRPTPDMVRTLGSGGHLCLVVDSLSERGVGNASEQLARLVRDDRFRLVVVTSRAAPPAGPVWERFEHLAVQPLDRAQISAFIAAYTAPHEQGDEKGSQRERVEERLGLLLERPEPPSPLYLRFAIERALEGALEQTSWQALVLDYLEGLRRDRIDLAPDDMVRACRLAAIESLRDSPTPRQVDIEYLRGVLARAADELPFHDARHETQLRPAKVIELLLDCGVLHRNRAQRRFLQFTYDPVAEELARPERPS